MEPWLVRMTLNVCRGAGRKRSRTRELFVNGDNLQGEDSGKNPYAQLRTEEQKRFLYEALAGLAEKERTAIVLRDIEGLTTAEVAEILGSAEATVRSQISVARLKMRKAIARMKGGRDVLLSFEALVALHVEGDLDESERQRVESHLRTCAECWDLAEDLRESQAIFKSIRQDVPNKAMLSAVRARVLEDVAGMESGGWFSRFFPFGSARGRRWPELRC